MPFSLSRRRVLQSTLLAGFGFAAIGRSAIAQGKSSAILPSDANSLAALSQKLTTAPRRRDFKTTQMILQHPDEWDSEALDLVLAYSAGPRQVWDNTNLEGPWLNLMRNALNAQIWSFKHPDFLAVSATHGPAHLALLDDYIWTKYDLGNNLLNGKYQGNNWVKTPTAAQADPAQIEDANGVFSPADNSISVLQERGVVFLACHNAIWEITGHLLAKGINPDKKTQGEVASELTNHLIPGAVLTPGVVGAIVELENAGFRYTSS